MDDEPLARDNLRLALAGISGTEIVAECADGDAAIAAIRERRPDVVFLDIQMPGRDGFEVIEEIGVPNMPEVVFVTAFDENALQAFEVQALDYLLKPFDDERFEAALQRARERIRQQQGGDLDIRLRALLEEVRGGSGYLQRLVVPTGNRSVFIRTEQIDWIEAERNYIRLHVGGRAYLLRENLSRIEASLDPGRFCRIHRSTIVNIDRIQAVESLFRGEYLVVLHDGTKLTSGRRYRGNLHAIMGKES